VKGGRQLIYLCSRPGIHKENKTIGKVVARGTSKDFLGLEKLDWLTNEPAHLK